MGQFLDSLLLDDTGRKERGRPVYIVRHRFRFSYGNWICGGVVEVPAGFATDLASVPRLLWSAAPPWTAKQAATIHDFLYEDKTLPRYLCDAIFRMAMRDCGLPGWKAWWIWLAVRIFGGHAYRS